MCIVGVCMTERAGSLHANPYPSCYAYYGLHNSSNRKGRGCLTRLENRIDFCGLTLQSGTKMPGLCWSVEGSECIRPVN